jgi:hypothetical protein
MICLYAHLPQRRWQLPPLLLAAALLLFDGAAVYRVAADCDSDLSCGLNGVCSASSDSGTTGVCICDRPWTGESCERLKFRAVSMPQGYGMAPNKTTWGGNILAAAGAYHLFASAMTNGCGLGDWSSNSRIEHAVSTTPTGPYKFAQVAVPTWAHNAAPIALPGGSYAIVHIGTGSGKVNGGRHCTPNGTTATTEVGTELSTGGTKPPRGSRIHISASLDGPWLPLLNDTLPTSDCDNPAPWVHPNSSIFVACGRAIKGNLINVWRADQIWGPWSFVTGLNHTAWPKPKPPGKWEDVFIYTDKRGHWHALWHAFYLNEGHRSSCVNSTVSAHSFSLDGYTWHAGATQPYDTQVQVLDPAADSGTQTITVSTRERPKLLFDEHGQMTHLVNGVSGASQCEAGGPPSACTNCKLKYWDYTLVAPLDV